MLKFGSKVKDMLYVFMTSFFSKGIMGVITLLIIKYMDYEEYALYTFLLSVSGLVSGIFVASVNNIYIVGCNKLSLEKDKTSLCLVQTVLVVVFTVLLGNIFAIEGTGLLAVTLLTVAVCFSEFIKTAYQNIQNFSQYNHVELYRVGIFAILIFVYVFLFTNSILAISVILLNSLAFLAAAMMNKKVFSICSFNQCLGDGVKTFKIIFTSDYKFLFIYMALLTFLANVNVFFLRMVASESDLASYGVAFQFYNIYALVLGAITTVMFPGIVNAETKQKMKDLFELQSKIFKVMLLFVAVTDVFIVEFIKLYFVGKYDESILAFLVFSLLAVFSVMLSPYMTVVLKFECFKPLCKCVFGVVLLHCLSVFFLYPMLGILGMALSLSLSYTLINIYGYVKGKKFLMDKY
ncbi:lipopolysaccharide biosynthesis protein [Selenomonas ruminis]|uniref:Oligosaccharide flippase family protein n=1 Tax=Selenomonas ruminis TaxID=2593411 RepID=A0A5D6W0B4_9FIRM|nr:hypothetical protein [Selenomonas sp. mPRGC5]TYZ20639.1 hypothetical protein FZ040_11585 [Selenomonas sp. mPRGC5]